MQPWQYLLLLVPLLYLVRQGLRHFIVVIGGTILSMLGIGLAHQTKLLADTSPWFGPAAAAIVILAFAATFICTFWIWQLVNKRSASDPNSHPTLTRFFAKN